MRMKNPKVLQLGKSWPVRGGVEKVMYELAVGLGKRGIPCDMMAASCNGCGKSVELCENSRLFTSRTWRKIAGTMISPSMVRLLRRECGNYDIIHIHHPDPMAAFALYLSGFKGKIVLHWHSDIVRQKKYLHFFLPLQRWLLKRADTVIGTSPVYVRESPYLKDFQHKTCCLPIGIGPIVPDAAGVEALRRRYGGRKIVFSMGRLVPYKGYDYLIDAARYLDDSYVVVIGGDGPLRKNLQARIDTSGLGGKVMLPGRIADADVSAYFGACTLFCLSSVYKSEAFAIVQVEAMSCGKPVVATRIPQSGVSWVNAHGYSGLNVATCDARQLARGICDISGDDAVYQRYCRQARRRYEECFTKEKMIENLVEIYKQLWSTNLKY